ncbi:hypothetical protein DAMA08_021860 [Martiniozyma asiatica (nom. inval.)]|nr:hypothetical protein DAMA08_021860 [Martiniozyma asiatica]
METCVLAPLLIVQGLKAKGDTDFSKTEDYGVKLTIERHLDPVEDPVVDELVACLEQYNVRNKLAWPKSGQGSPWFNIRYDCHSDILVNGGESRLSPWRGEFKNTLLPIQWLEKYYNQLPVALLGVYELGEEELDGTLISEILRVKKQLDGTQTNFYCIVFTQGPVCEERAKNIREKTEMSDTGSLYFVTNSQHPNSVKDRTIFFNKFLSVIKRHALDFFNNQIRKLKQRIIKDESYPESWFQVRYFLKLTIFELFKGLSEYSTNLLTRIYSRLIALLQSKLPNETKFQILKWSDIFNTQLVRAHLVTNNYSAAFKTFISHLSNIKKYNNSISANEYLSIKYELFGDLLHEFSGTPPQIPHLGFIYLQAEAYKSKILDEKDSTDKRLKLLLKALKTFSGDFGHTESVIYIKIAQLYQEQQNYSMAFNNYLAAGVTNGEIGWWVKSRLIECHQQLGYLNKAWSIWISLCLFDVKPIHIQKLENLKNTLDPITESVNAEVFDIKMAALQTEVTLPQKLSIQMSLTRKRAWIQSLEISKINIPIAGHNITINTNGDTQTSLKSESMLIFEVTDTNSEFKTNLSFTPQKGSITKIFQFDIEVPVGTIEIPQIDVLGEFNGVPFISTVTYTICDRWWSSADGIPLHPPARLENRPQSESIKIDVLPRMPVINFQLHYDQVAYQGQWFAIGVSGESKDTEPVKFSLTSQLKNKWDFELPPLINPNDKFKGALCVKIPTISTKNFTIVLNVDYEFNGLQLKDIKEVKVKVIPPFKLHVDVKCKQGIMPNVFKLNNSEYQRRWDFNLNLKNGTFGQVFVKELKLDIVNNESQGECWIENNDDFKCELDYDGFKEGKVELANKKGKVDVELIANIIYEMDKNEQIWKTSVWKGKLNALDPRVIAQLVEYQDSHAVVEYIVENPTRNTLQYQSNLNTLEGVTILDYVKVRKFVIVPFGIVRFKFVYEGIDKLLPEFKIWDRGHELFVRIGCGKGLLWEEGHFFIDV